MDLFGSHNRIIVADTEGGIRLWEDFTSGVQAEAWFSILKEQVGWKHHQRPMYERIVDVPRLLAEFRVENLPPALPLTAMLQQVNAIVPAPYNAIGLNFYRDGNDSVAMHNDKLHTLLGTHPIALISLGSARRMTIKAKHGDRQFTSIDLPSGSLLAMSHASQITHEHGIPKTRLPVGPRISIVFRARPQGWRPYYE